MANQNQPPHTSTVSSTYLYSIRKCAKSISTFSTNSTHNSIYEICWDLYTKKQTHQHRKKSQHLLSWRLTSGMWHKQNIVERCRMAFWNTAFDGVTVFSHVFWLPLKAHKGWIWVTIKMKSSNQSSQGGHNSSMPPGGISARIFPTPTLERNQCTLLWKASK